LIVEWLPDAVLDLDEIFEFIAQDNPDAAYHQIKMIHEQVGKLKEKLGRKGRKGRVPGTMELVIIGTPFVVPYRMMPGKYQILRVLHSSREWPNSFE
jgi:toxin ParE1/3/4